MLYKVKKSIVLENIKKCHLDVPLKTACHYFYQNQI